MSMKSTILDHMKDAMKAGDKARVGVLRLLRAELQKRELELRAKQGKDYEIDDDEALGVLARAAKQRRESIESYRAGDRDDLAAVEEAELAVIETYLPQGLSEDEVRRIVTEAVAEAGATSPKDMGAVMRLVMPRVKGRADGKMVNRLVKSTLEG